jgi:hypothetical protein
MSDPSADEQRAALNRRANDAIWTHHTWVSILRKAIAERACERSVAETADGETCDIGRWLASEIPPAFRSTELYDTTLRIHRRFHVEAANVLRLALAGEREAALASMEPVGDFFLVAAHMRTVLYEWATAAQPTDE